MEGALRRGEDVESQFPWLLEEPEIVEGDSFYLQAFYQLSTCRQIGMGIGPIPLDSIVAYAERAKLDEDMQRNFEFIIIAMDKEFLEKWIKPIAEGK